MTHRLGCFLPSRLLGWKIADDFNAKMCPDAALELGCPLATFFGFADRPCLRLLSAPTYTIVPTATPLRVVLCPVFSEFWRAQGKFSFGIRSEVVEVKNLYHDSSGHGLFANLRYASLY